MGKLVIFDLDGTLSDSGPGITRCVQHAYRMMGYPEQTEEVLRSFIGPPLVTQFMAVSGMTRDQAWKATDIYRERYERDGKFDNTVYPGIPELLKDLRDAGFSTAVGTSKPGMFTTQIIDHFGLTPLFDTISAPGPDETRSNKQFIIEQAMETLGYADRKKDVIMVGDRKYDIVGAKSAGVTSVGVTYGFGDRRELEEAGADVIVDSVEELRGYLLGQN